MTRSAKSLFIFTLLLGVSSQAVEAQCIKAVENKGKLALKIVALKKGLCPKGTISQTEGPAGPAGSDSLRGLTNINVSNTYTTSLTNGDMERLGTVGYYTKGEGPTLLKVSFFSSGSIDDDSNSGGNCSFQVRVDDVSADGTSGATFSSGNGGTASFAINAGANALGYSNLSATGVFSSSSQGLRTISLWGRASGVDSCTLNPDALKFNVLVEEVNAVLAPSPFVP